jgi:prepilin-type N-terminal cleavage/methylation domain-containing protein
MFQLLKNKRKFRNKPLGFTLIEVLVASAITVMVLLAVVYLFYIGALTTREIYGPTRSRSARMIAFNEIRFRLCDARIGIGNCSVLDNGHQIQFIDPNNGNDVKSELHFNDVQRKLYYKKNIDTAGDPIVIAKGPINITFTLGSTDLDVPNHLLFLGIGSVVTVYVQTSSELSYSKVDTRDGETVVYLRNP